MYISNDPNIDEAVYWITVYLKLDIDDFNNYDRFWRSNPCRKPECSIGFIEHSGCPSSAVKAYVNQWTLLEEI